MSEKPPYPAEPPPPYMPGQAPYPTGQNLPPSMGPAPYPVQSGPPLSTGQSFYPAPPPQPTMTYYPTTTATTATTTVIVTAPSFGLGPNPVNTQCPNCYAQILTETRPTAGLLAWLVCIGCIFFGCVLGCCLIPFCIDDLQDVEHRCPQCKYFLGNYRRI